MIQPHCRLTACVVIALVWSTEGIAHAESLAPTPSRGPFVFSPMGPGENKVAGAFGLRWWVAEKTPVKIPTLQLDLIYGVSDDLDLETRFSTWLLLSLFDFGVRYRVYGDESFSFAVRADAVFAVVFPLAGAFAAAPGLVVAGGDNDFQISVSLDFPALLAMGAFTVVGGQDQQSGEIDAKLITISNTGFLPTVRPSITAEWAVGGSVSIYFQFMGWWFLPTGDKTITGEDITTFRLAPETTVGVVF